MNLPMSEDDLQLAVCQYLRVSYPEALFWSDGSGNNLSRAQAAKNTELRSSPGVPDLCVPVPRGGYHGLFLELKREDVKLHKKDGSWATPHIALQAEVLTRLDESGYMAYFARGFKEAVEIIDEYFSLEASRTRGSFDASEAAASQ